MAGYNDAKGVLARSENDVLLWSTNGEHKIPVLIDGAAIDTGNAGDTRLLRKGLVMVPVTATGRYRQFDDDLDNGQELEEDAIILCQDVRVDGTNHQAATGLRAGCPRAEALVWKDAGAKAAFDWSAVQRFDVR